MVAIPWHQDYINFYKQGGGVVLLHHISIVIIIIIIATYLGLILCYVLVHWAVKGQTLQPQPMYFLSYFGHYTVTLD